MSRERISACLIVQDEQERLPAALESVAFCDEAIVVDGGSNDGTVELARSAGARVIENPWPGFARQRNLALDAATGEWIFEIDADERISPELRASVEALLAADSPRAIAVSALRHWFLGRPLGPSAKYPTYRARMFRRGSYRHDESRMVHEGVEPHERPVVLEGDLEHQLATTLREALIDAWRYARLEAVHLTRPRRPAAYLKGILLRPAAKLLYRTLVERGWRDGWRGLLKISLDVGSDALVWVLVLLRGAPASGSPAPEPAPGASPATGQPQHFGRRPSGPVKVVAISGAGRSAIRARELLAGLQGEGFDVTLISTSRNGREGQSDAGEEPMDGVPQRALEDVPVHVLRRLRPLELISALEIEMQLRTIDALVPVGAHARLVRHLVPKTLRPEIPGLNDRVGLKRAVALANEARAPR